MTRDDLIAAFRRSDVRSLIRNEDGSWRVGMRGGSIARTTAEVISGLVREGLLQLDVTASLTAAGRSLIVDGGP